MNMLGSMDRRRFVRLLAASAAAAAAAPITKAAGADSRHASSRKTPTPAHRPVTAAMRREIESQKKSISDTLKAIRSYELPAGSPPAPIFRAMRARSAR